MKMNKIFALAAAAAMALSMAACETTDDLDKADQSTGASVQGTVDTTPSGESQPDNEATTPSVNTESATQDSTNPTDESTAPTESTDPTAGTVDGTEPTEGTTPDSGNSGNTGSNPGGADEPQPLPNEYPYTVTWQEYQDMSGEEQQAFYNDFPSHADFKAWRTAAKKKYDDDLIKIEIGEDGKIDLDGAMNSNN